MTVRMSYQLAVLVAEHVFQWPNEGGLPHDENPLSYWLVKRSEPLHVIGIMPSLGRGYLYHDADDQRFIETLTSFLWEYAGTERETVSAIETRSGKRRDGTFYHTAEIVTNHKSQESMFNFYRGESDLSSGCALSLAALAWAGYIADGNKATNSADYFRITRSRKTKQAEKRN